MSVLLLSVFLATAGRVTGMGEEHDPVVADELVEVDRAFGGLGLEVRGD
jgi:hypothetical protein